MVSRKTFTSILPLAAVGAVFEGGFQGPPALGAVARCGAAGRRTVAGLVFCRPFHGLVAAPAEQKGIPAPDRQQGDEKEAQVVIHPLEIGLLQTARRAAARRWFQQFCSGLKPGDDKTHG